MNNELLTKILVGNKTKRDKQVRIGPSEIGGCRRKVWHRIQETPITNPDTLRLAAWMGTAIHAAIEKEFDRHDPFSLRYVREAEVEYEGMMGHVDCYDILEEEVIDWKTITKKKAAKFPSDQQIMQVQLYGYLLSKTGAPVKTVKLVGIVRDGNERDIKIYCEEYDESIALQGLAWLQDIRDSAVAPEPEMPARYFCRDYCSYWSESGDGCPGL